MIYFLIILYLLFSIIRFDIIPDSKNRLGRNKRVMLIVAYCFFVCIPSLSFRMGSDTMGYESWYLHDLNPLYKFSFDDDNWEPLFCLVMSLFKTMKLNWLVVHFIIIGFINYCIFSFAKRYVRPIFTFLLIYFLLYFYEYNFETLRQSLAMGIVLLAIPLLEEKKYLIYFILTIVAIGFHHAAFTALIIPFVQRVHITNIFSVLFIAGMLIVGNYIFTNFYDVIRIISFNSDYYMSYDGKESVTTVNNVFGILYHVIGQILPVYVAVKILKVKSAMPNKHFEGILFLFMAFVMLSSYLRIVDRFAQFLGVIQVVVYAKALMITNKNPKNTVFISILKTYIILAFGLNLYIYNASKNEFDFPNYRRYYPYTSIFEKQKDSDRENKLLYKK